MSLLSTDYRYEVDSSFVDRTYTVQSLSDSNKMKIVSTSMTKKK